MSLHLSKAVLLAAVLHLAASAQPIVTPNQAWGAPSNGIRMALSATDPSHAAPGTVEFSLAFENVGAEDTLLNLGIMVGKILEPSKVHFVLTGPDGQFRKFPYSSGRIGAIGGRIDDFIVALPSRATYALKFDLARLLIYPPLKLRPGRYRLSARFEGRPAHAKPDTPAIAFWPFWKGVLRSNSAEFDLTAPPRK